MMLKIEAKEEVECKSISTKKSKSLFHLSYFYLVEKMMKNYVFAALCPLHTYFNLFSYTTFFLTTCKKGKILCYLFPFIITRIQYTYNEYVSDVFNTTCNVDVVFTIKIFAYVLLLPYKPNHCGFCMYIYMCVFDCVYTKFNSSPQLNHFLLFNIIQKKVLLYMYKNKSLD